MRTREVVLRLRRELLAPRPDALERDDLAEPLHGVDGVRVQVARHLPRPRAQPIDARPRQDGRERGIQQERQEHQRERPAEGARAWRAPRPARASPRRPGVMVWAKKYSISSMSWVATPTRSPVRRRVR